MPNHISNELTLRGPGLSAFRSMHRHLSLQKIQPTREWMRFGNTRGTYDVSSCLTPGVLVYRFLTAWGPFEMDILNLITAQPGVTVAELRYAGGDICGTMTSTDGCETSHECESIEHSDEYTDLY